MAGQKGRSGRKKIPAATKKLRGTFRKDRDAEPAQLEVPESFPEPLFELREDVRELWDSLVPRMLQIGLLTDLDVMEFNVGFRWYNVFVATAEQLHSVSEMYHHTEKGTPIQHPLVSIHNQASAKVSQFCSKFGLSPSARSGMTIQNVDTNEAQGETDPMSEFVN